MKNRNFYNLFVVLVLSGILFLGCSPGDRICSPANEKVHLYYANIHVPYVGNETIKFLHNNIDTQIFIGQGKLDYYVSDHHAGEGICPNDHQCQAVKFINSTTNDVFIFRYEYDEGIFQFTSSSSSNPYTFYKLTYKNKTFCNKFYFSDTNRVIINSQSYQYVDFIGVDTNNYVAFETPTGILRIRINNENWDLIP